MPQSLLRARPMTGMGCGSEVLRGAGAITLHTRRHTRTHVTMSATHKNTNRWMGLSHAVVCTHRGNKMCTKTPLDMKDDTARLCCWSSLLAVSFEGLLNTRLSSTDLILSEKSQKSPPQTFTLLSHQPLP